MFDQVLCNSRSFLLDIVIIGVSRGNGAFKHIQINTTFKTTEFYLTKVFFYITIFSFQKQLF